MPTHALTLRQLLRKASHRFYVPPYQRRYVWGQALPGEKDAAEHLAACLSQAAERGEPYFLQGITVAFGPQGCALVDGQQRLTCLRLMLDSLGGREEFAIAYACRPAAERWMAGERPVEQTIDIHYFEKTLRTTARALSPAVDADYIYNKVYFLCIELDSPEQGAEAFAMMNGAKQPMETPDIIKADIMRLASDPEQPGADQADLLALRARYAAEWESWARWWNAPEAISYFAPLAVVPLDLQLRLVARGPEGEGPLTYDEFHALVKDPAEAKRFFHRLRRAQKRAEELYDNPVAYNRIKAVMLLFDQPERLRFLHALWVESAIAPSELERIYKLAFLGMTYSEIMAGDDPAARFDDLLATLSMADIYHSEAKPLAMRLLLRLNLDEDIKLGRRFDFSAWSSRSLEHIFSKSKVWHLGPKGETLDGNDNPLHASPHKLERDPSMLRRDDIKNADGAQLSEHCIGNLVLLYGKNNAAFGNATFEQKKHMFLTPSADQAFQSRNLLHSVCVFARDRWTAQSIVDNYNLTLKNLKLYYGYK